MKKLIYLIVLALILGLVLTGCLLSNISQVPATGQSGVAYLTKGPASLSVISDENTMITKVYNKAGGGSEEVPTSQNAVRAWEPDPYSTTYPVEPAEATDSTWDSGVPWFQANSSADWIWETHIAEGPASYDPADSLYDDNAPRWGRVVLFEATFDIPGNPTSATLHIAADNGYEVWVNNGSHHFSTRVVGGSGWENSALRETSLLTTGWAYDGNFTIPASDLASGPNTLYVLAGNEYCWTDDAPNLVPTVGTWGEPGYHQFNHGAVIFHLDIDYEVVIEEAPGIAIEKSGPATAHEGDIITYTYTVTNAGDVPLSAVAVSDDLAGAAVYVSGDTNLDEFLDLDETWIFTASYEIPEGTGPVENTAEASGTSPHLTIVTAQDNWSVVVLHPDISVTKVADTTQYYIDGSVTYTIVVTNTGDCTLYNISVVDDILGTLDTGLTLAPGASETYYPVTYPAVETVTNIVTATGSDVLGKEVTATATATVIIEHGFTLTWGYWKTHSSYGPAPYDDTWALLLPSGADTDFFYSGMTYYEVLWTSVAGGNAYYQLAHQYIAAELNKLSEAWMRDDVQAAFDEATELLGTYTPAQIESFKKGTPAEKLIFARFNYLAGILDDYNKGLMGTPHAP